MRYFIALYIFTIYLFAYNSMTVDESGEYIIIDEENQIEFEEMNSLIRYIDLEEAKEEAKVEHKFILVKIESSNCPTCNKLNTLLDTNENIKNMVNGYTKAVKLNNDYDHIPPKLEYIGTPTLFLFDSSGKKMLMKLQGSEAIDDIEESLELFIYDNS